MNEEQPMRQQVDVWAHLTYDADATLDAANLRAAIVTDLNRLTDADSDSAIELQMAAVATIREEATIYSDGNGPADMLITLKRIVEAFPAFSAYDRNSDQNKALEDARSIVEALS